MENCRWSSWCSRWLGLQSSVFWGILFYRFISENFKTYIEGGDESINYEEISEDLITPEVRDDAIKTKGYFIMPSQLFSNVVKTARQNEHLNTDLKDIFDDIESSAIGYASEHDIKGLFWWCRYQK